MPKRAIANIEQVKEKAIILYLANYNARQIGDQLGIGTSTAHNWITAYHDSLENKLSDYGISLFEREFFKHINAVDADIQRLTQERIQEPDKDRQDKLDDMIFERRKYVHEVRGDSDLVLALRKQKSDGKPLISI